MIFPDDLPGMVEYRMSLPAVSPVCIRTALPRTPVKIMGGRLNACLVCPQIPIGATGWRLPGESAWRLLSTIPQRWYPFLNRQRGTEMDYRPMSGPPPVVEGEW